MGSILLRRLPSKSISLIIYNLMIMKFNHDFYIYIIVTFFWVLAIPKAGNIYETIICIACTIIGIFAALRILFKNK